MSEKLDEVIFREVNVKRCARCQEDHDNMEFFPLKNPADEWAWWGTCPNVKQPVLMRMSPPAVGESQ
jgi:hypothetical protein